jgi:large subunit ribosomal protein L28
MRAKFDREEDWRVQPRLRHVKIVEPLDREADVTIQRITKPNYIRLTRAPAHGSLRGFFEMKVCNITGSRAARGSVIHRRGLAKKKGGVGRHITKMVPRIFAPNLRRQRVWVPELKKFVRIRVTARGLKTINKHGAYKALKKAGAI